jgi:hypothetical protein
LPDPFRDTASLFRRTWAAAEVISAGEPALATMLRPASPRRLIFRDLASRKREKPPARWDHFAMPAEIIRLYSIGPDIVSGPML